MSDVDFYFFGEKITIAVVFTEFPTYYWHLKKKKKKLHKYWVYVYILTQLAVTELIKLNFDIFISFYLFVWECASNSQDWLKKVSM